jgi:hypothetical protein
MGDSYFNSILKTYVKEKYPLGSADLYGCFILRNLEFCKKNGFLGMITIPNWMFLSSFENLRHQLLDNNTIETLVHNGRGIWGSDFGSCSFTIRDNRLEGYKGTYKRLFEKQGSVACIEELERRFFVKKNYVVLTKDLKKIPGSPIAYWLTYNEVGIFSKGQSLHEYADIKQGLITGDNDRFLKLWYEVDLLKIGFGCSDRKTAEESKKKWFPYQKGGDYRKWFGNNEYIVNWEKDGEEIKNFVGENGRLSSRPQNLNFYFRYGGTWSSLTIGSFAIRYVPVGFIFDAKGSMLFPKQERLNIKYLISYGNTKLFNRFLGALSPSVDYSQGAVGNVPYIYKLDNSIVKIAESAISIAKQDWDSSETSWDFQTYPWANGELKGFNAQESFENWKNHCNKQIQRMKELEEENNRLFVEAYGLQDELTPEFPEEEITLTINPKYRYGGNYTDEELWQRFREDSVKELISYAIGCMMGRYSLDEPGLIYAHSGNEGFDPSRYKTFPADADGIIPAMDEEWFSDDATNRFLEFLKAVWLPETLRDNLDFVAESLGQRKEESPIETIRRYLSNEFFKDHLRTYKKRPIYWLFSSGKYKAFECLVYLHRYNEAALSRMRSEYVTPLQGKLNARIEYLENEIKSATTASSRKLQRELDLLKKKQGELSAYDDELRHYADMRIKLDLDYGVKVNYGKFGNLLAEVKTITGDKGD